MKEDSLMGSPVGTGRARAWCATVQDSVLVAAPSDLIPSSQA